MVGGVGTGIGDKLGPPGRPTPEVKSDESAAAKKAPAEKLEAKATLAAPPRDVYKAWLAALHGPNARPAVGDSFQLAQGALTGTTVQLSPDEGAVHQWRSAEHAAAPDSRLNVGFQATDRGTHLHLGFEDVPTAHAATLVARWREYGLGPLAKALAHEQGRTRGELVGASDVDGMDGSSSGLPPLLMALFTAQDVLECLDAAESRGAFPYLRDEPVETVDVRLCAFASTQRWGMSIEWLCVDPRTRGHAGIANRVYCFGTGLASGRAFDGCTPLPLTADAEAPTFDDPGDVDAAAAALRVRGARVAIPSAAAMKALGVPVQRTTSLQREELMRALVLTDPQGLFLSPSELRARLPLAGTLLVQLEAWNHPRRRDGPPSGSETFQLLAQVLASGQRSRYRPTLRPNTGWR